MPLLVGEAERGVVKIRTHADESVVSALVALTLKKHLALAKVVCEVRSTLGQIDAYGQGKIEHLGGQGQPIGCFFGQDKRKRIAAGARFLKIYRGILSLADVLGCIAKGGYLRFAA